MDKDTERQIARINELSALARTSWIGLLAYLAFVFVTLLGVEDADFFVPSRQTQLPLVNVSIPTASFFVFAPILAAALYVYLHLFLLKLWDAIAEAPTTVDGRPLADVIHPWLVNALATSVIGGAARARRPLDWLSNAVTGLLVWVAGPFVIAWAWWRSMPAHAEVLTSLIGVGLLISLLACATSFWRARARLAPFASDTWEGWWKWVLAVTTVFAVASLTWLRTERGIDEIFPALWPGALPAPFNRVVDVATLAKTDLVGQDLVPLPPDWRSPETARKEFRATWCAREALPMAVCDHLPEADRTTPAHVAEARQTYCVEHSIESGLPCTVYFAALDARFVTDWAEERASARANLPALDLSGRDLRDTNAAGASLVAADLSQARMTGAHLWRARLEGATLRNVSLDHVHLGEAELQGANLRAASLFAANFTRARLSGADLREANLERAQLPSARMEGALLWEAELANARLQGAQLQGADLSQANMSDAMLDQAQMHGADLTLANLNGAKMRSTRLDGAILLGTRLERAELYRAQLTGAEAQNAHLNGATLVEADLTEADLRDAHLTGASLRGATLVATNFIDASLEDADLSGAEILGATLWDTNVRDANWEEATLTGVAPWADFRGAINLTQDQLDGLIGNRATLLPAELAPDTGRAFTIWSCWADPPPEYDRLVAILASTKYDDEAEARADTLCAADERPEPRGVPCSLELTPAQCVDPAINPDHPANRDN